jgi:hypothetical protein
MTTPTATPTNRPPEKTSSQKQEVITKIYSKKKKELIPIPEDSEALMGEVAAAAFNDVTPRAMQNFRLTGEGPRFVRISSRCIKYRKKDLIEWQESKLRTSTSDEGEESDGRRERNE